MIYVLEHSFIISGLFDALKILRGERVVGIVNNNV